MFVSGNGPIQVQYFAECVLRGVKEYLSYNDRVSNIKTGWTWFQLDFQPSRNRVKHVLTVDAKFDEHGIFFVIHPLESPWVEDKIVRVKDSKTLLEMDVDNIHVSEVQRWVEQNMDLDSVVEEITEHIDWMIENY